VTDAGHITSGSIELRPEVEQRAAAVAEARTWLRTPYHHMGRMKGAGADCATLLIEVYAAAGLIENFDPGYYPQDWMKHRDEERYLGWVEKYCVPTEAPQPGDLVLYKIGRCFSHGAIVIAWPTCIHARWLPKGGTIELVDFSVEEYFKGRERRFYTLWPKG